MEAVEEEVVVAVAARHLHRRRRARSRGERLSDEGIGKGVVRRSVLREPPVVEERGEHHPNHVERFGAAESRNVGGGVARSELEEMEEGGERRDGREGER